MNRTTVDLIEELEAEKNNFTDVALAIGFDSTTTFIFATEDGKLDKLNGAVEAGGEPVGFLGIDIHNGLLSIQQHPLREYAEEEWVEQYLYTLASTLREKLKEQYPSAINELTFPAGNA
jgi:hypothetical protein